MGHQAPRGTRNSDSASRPFDLAVGTILGHRCIQPHIEARNLVLMIVDLQPGFRPNSFSLPMKAYQPSDAGFVGATLKSWYFDLMWGMYKRLMWGMFLKKAVNDCRKLAGLNPLSSHHEYYARMFRAPVILGYLEEITPTPYPPRTNALRDVRAQGALMLDDKGRATREALPATLEAFLAAGPPPVYVGFGSMPFDAATTAALLVRA